MPTDEQHDPWEQPTPVRHRPTGLVGFLRRSLATRVSIIVGFVLMMTAGGALAAVVTYSQQSRPYSHPPRFWPTPTQQSQPPSETASPSPTPSDGASVAPSVGPSPTDAAPPSPTTPGQSTCAGTCPNPGAANTGVPAGVTLANLPDNIAGSYQVTTDGTIIDGKHISGSLIIAANNVVVRNSLIDGNVTDEVSGQIFSFTITDSTVGAASGCQFGAGITTGHYTATRVHVRGYEDGFEGSVGPVTIRDSYAVPCSLPSTHSDGIQENSNGPDGLVMEHNTIDMRNASSHTAPINLVGSATKNVTLTDNLLLGGTYAIFLDPYASPWGKVQNNRVVNGTWDFGPVETHGKCNLINWSANSLVTIDANYNVVSTLGTLPCPS